MGKYDLNDSLDFAKITGQGVGSVLLAFTGRGESAWDIREGGFYHDPDDIAYFHVFGEANTNFQGALRQISDTGGRRKAKFEFPYLDGQMTEDLGRKPETFELDVIIHGNNYLAAFNKLITELNDPRPGQLIHPVRGNIECVCENYQIMHQSDSRKAVALRLTFIENSFAGITLRQQTDSSAPNAIAKLVDAIRKIGNAITVVEGALNVARSVKNAVNQSLTEYNNRFSKTSANLNGTFNPGNKIPALTPVTQGGLLNEDGSLASTFTTVVSTPNDPYTNLPPELTDSTLQTALATENLFNDITSLRAELQGIISDIESINNGDGALEFFDIINDLRQTAIDMQDAFDKGKQSSRVQIIEYTVPREMSVREIAFMNGIPVDNVSEILLLNSEFENSNNFAVGTKLKLAVTR